MDFELKDKLAYALFRRDQIDQVEYERLKLGLTEPGAGRCNGVYSASRHEICEQSIETAWAADGSTRAKWYQLAREALCVIQGNELKGLPGRLSCPECNGIGKGFETTAECSEAVQIGQIREEEGSGLRTCILCGGSGLPE
jgi:hypothetical protein